jgi:hypothetical protein
MTGHIGPTETLPVIPLSTGVGVASRLQAVNKIRIAANRIFTFISASFVLMTCKLVKKFPI